MSVGGGDHDVTGGDAGLPGRDLLGLVTRFFGDAEVVDDDEGDCVLVVAVGEDESPGVEGIALRVGLYGLSNGCMTFQIKGQGHSQNSCEM